MCEFASALVDIREGENYGRLYSGYLNSHGGIERAYGLTPGEYGELEWTADDGGESLVLRGCPDDMRSTILSRYSTRSKMLKALAAQGGGKVWIEEIGKIVDVPYEYNRGAVAWRYRCWYSDGTRCEDYTYRNGELHGRYRCWYSDGMRREDCTYRDGELVKEADDE